MSYRVFLARPGFKDTPIPVDAWLAAVERRDDLSVEELPSVPMEEGGEVHRPLHLVRLKQDRHAQMNLNGYGIVEAQNPPPALVEVMFELAATLDAGVYSERLNRYASLADWETRTRKYRNSREQRRARGRKAVGYQILIWFLVASTLIGLAWLIGGAASKP